MAAETFRIEIPISVEDHTDPGVSQATRKINGFDRANQKTQERLNQMNRTKYQVVLDALDRASGIIGKVSSKARSIAGKTFSFTMKVIDMATAPLRGIWNFATSIQGAILGATGAFAGIYKPMDIAGDYEQTQIAFETMLKSAEKAEQFLKDASEFANKTPFEFPELINSSKLLLAFGFETDKILDLMTVIGDTSSGLGAGAEGIDRITRALGQMQAKGRAQAEELLQLQELGVPANQILQEELGLTGEQVANIGKESIEASKVIDALLRGMEKRFGGMMANQSKTAKGMISTLKDTLENSLLRPWGQGLWEGVKPGLEKITTWIDENQETIAAWGEAWKKAGANISKWVMTKVEDLQGRIRRMTNSQEWKDAQTFGAKMKIAWEQVIAQPFNEWWNSTGKVWIADKASKVGEGIGSGMTMGLLALLGIDVSATTQEGKNVGGAFIKGFTEGFDTEKITEALKTWADKNKEIVVGLGILIGGKLAAGIISGLGKLKDAKELFGGKGSNDGLPATAGTPSAYTTTTMTVSARIVNVYGATVRNVRDTFKRVATNAASAAGGAAIGTGGTALMIGAGAKTAAALPGAATLALPGATTAGAAGATSLKALWLAQAPGGAAGAALANTGTALGSTATTAAGAAAAGAAGSAGIIGGILGLGSAAIDLFQGIGKGKSGDEKGAKDEYVTAGTKAGMVGAGAATGALIGSVVPGVGTAIGALVGAGIGGAGALLGGDKAGKALSDASDSGGWLSNAGKAIGDFFTKTMPKGWNSFWGGVGNFFTNTIPKWWGNLTAGVSTFFTETIPAKWSEFWEGVGNFFTETIPYAIGYAVGKAEIFFTQDIPAFFSGIWNGIKTFFTSTLPTWATSTWNNNIVPFFTQDIPAFFGGLWTGISTFFTSTLPTWATNVWNNNIKPFFTESIPQFFTDVWNAIKGFFTDALPTIASGIWGGIKSFFTDTIPNFFKDIWGSITSFFSAGYSDAKSGAGYGATKHATGGIFTQPHMGLVAEAGAESIIPLSPSKRTRGIDLWRETGELLGVRPYANGGIVGGIKADDSDIPVAAGSSGGGVTIKVEVSANPEITIGTSDTGDDERILSVLKTYIRSMADDIGDELAERLARIFANMPVRA